MTLLLSLGTLWLAGILTVATETFTHLISEKSWTAVLRGFLSESLIFTATAVAWGTSVWLTLYFQGFSVAFREVVLLMGFSHLPLLAYPLTIVPSIGYRLEQLLRFAVYLLFTVSVSWLAEVEIIHSAFACIGGWALHFLAVERRILSWSETARL